jgi:8-amino-7-oxononanoate synthase
LKKAAYLSQELKRLGFKLIERDPIPVVIPHIGKEDLGIKFARNLWKQGIFSPLIRWPAVPEGESRFRVLMMASHTNDHINHFIQASKRAGEELGVI